MNCKKNRGNEGRYCIKIGIVVCAAIVLVGIIVAAVYIIKSLIPPNAALEITPSGDIQEVYVGVGSFEIICRVTSTYKDQKWKLQWMDPGNNAILEGSGNPSSYAGPGKHTLKLKFVKPTAKHSGNYTCSYSYQDKSHRKQVTLKFIEVPDKIAEFENNYEKVMTTEGDLLLSVTCSAIGTGPITYEWYAQDGGSIKTTSSEYGAPYISQSGTVLNIPKVRGRDSGLYSCKATNQYGSDRKTFEILIFNDIAPRITSYSRNDTFYENNDLHLFCKAEGAGPLIFEWYNQKNETIKNDAFPGIYVNVEVASSYVEIKSTSVTHEGQYRCVVRNDYGSDSTSLYLSFLKDGKPKFNVHHRIYVVFENDDLHLSCDAEGTKPMTYEWYNKKNEPIEGDVSDGSKLTIKSEQITEGGLYTCLAKNAFGEDKKRFSVSISKDGPKFVMGRLDVTAYEEGETKLPCNPFKGAKPMEFAWFNQKSEPLENSTSYVISTTSSTSSLTIKSMQDSDLGEYRCEAGNSYGNATMRFNVSFSRTGRPKFGSSSETVEVKTGDKFQLECQASGELPISYTWYKQTDEITSNEISTTPYRSYLTVEHAQMSHFRIYSCVAKNAQGLSVRVIRVHVA